MFIINAWHERVLTLIFLLGIAMFWLNPPLLIFINHLRKRYKLH